MANTASITDKEQGRHQFQSFFNEMWWAKGSVSDQDAIANNDTVVAISLTVPGVALGDHIISAAFNNDLVDTDTVYVFPTFRVTAANTVTMTLWANAAFNVDDLNSSVFTFLVGRPNF